MHKWRSRNTLERMGYRRIKVELKLKDDLVFA
jgi:hypothetical protein